MAVLQRSCTSVLRRCPSSPQKSPAGCQSSGFRGHSSKRCRIRRCETWLHRPGWILCKRGRNAKPLPEWMVDGYGWWSHEVPCASCCVNGSNAGRSARRKKGLVKKRRRRRERVRESAARLGFARGLLQDVGDREMGSANPPVTAVTRCAFNDRLMSHRYYVCKLQKGPEEVIVE